MEKKLYPIAENLLYSVVIFYSLYLLDDRLIGLVGRVFVNGLVDQGSIPGCVIPKTLKMVLDISLLST